jgi:hypothetical protein
VGRTDTQDGDHISLFSFFESRLKTALGSISGEDVMWVDYKNGVSKPENYPDSIPGKDVTFRDSSLPRYSAIHIG